MASDHRGGQDGASSLASRLNLEKRQLTANSKYDFSSHIASLAHTSSLSHQRNNALSILAEEKAKASRYRSQSLRLAAGVAVRQSRIQQYNSTLAEIKSVLEQESIVQTEVKDVLQVCSSGVVTLVNDLKASRTSLAKASEEKQKLASQISAARVQLTESQRQNLEAQNQIQTIKGDHDVVCRRLGLSEAHVQQLGRDNEEHARKVQLFQTERDEHTKAHKDLESNSLKQNAENSKLRDQLAEAESRTLALESQLQDADTVRAEFETKLVEGRNELDRFRDVERYLREKLQAQTDLISERSSEQTALLEKITILETSQQRLTRSSNELRIELEQEQGRLSELKKVERVLQTQLGEYKSVVMRLESRIATLEAQLHDTTSTDRAQTLEQKLAESIAMLGQVKVAHEAEVTRLFASESALKTTLKSILEQNTNLSTQVQQLLDQKTTLELKVRGLDLEVAKLQETLVDQYALVNSNRSSYVSDHENSRGSFYSDMHSSVQAPERTAASPTPSLRRSGKQIARIASLEGLLQTKDQRLETMEKEFKEKVRLESQFRLQIQNLQHHSTQADKQLGYLSEKLSRQREDLKHWRKTCQDKDLYIMELEGFQRELRTQLFQTQRRKPSRPLLRESNSRLLMSGSPAPVQETQPQDQSLATRLKHQRLSSFSPSLLADPIAELNSLMVEKSPKTPSPTSSRGRESTLSSAGTRVSSSQGVPKDSPTLHQKFVDKQAPKPSLLQRFARFKHRKDPRHQMAN
jgi:chromosome segregation ATPase